MTIDEMVKNGYFGENFSVTEAQTPEKMSASKWNWMRISKAGMEGGQADDLTSCHSGASTTIKKRRSFSGHITGGNFGVK
jgi:hypothetical protein